MSESRGRRRLRGGTAAFAVAPGSVRQQRWWGRIRMDTGKGKKLDML